KAKVNDVDGNLGIEARPQLIPDQLLNIRRPLYCGGCSDRRCRGGLLTQGIGVFVRDAHQVAIVRHDGVRPTKRLCDSHLGACGEHDFLAAGNPGRFALAAQDDLLTGSHLSALLLYVQDSIAPRQFTPSRLLSPPLSTRPAGYARPSSRISPAWGTHIPPTELRVFPAQRNRILCLALW